MYDKNGISYCENPICDDKCPVGESAECIKNDNTKNINDKYKNKCKCYTGFDGEYCKNKVYVDFR